MARPKSNGSSKVFTATIGFEATAVRDSAVSKSEATLPGLNGNRSDISIYGQDKWARRQRPFGLATRARRVRLRGQQPKQSNATTRRLAVMNLALRGIEADFSPEHADTFRPDLRADYGLANPPFNDSDWFRKDEFAAPNQEPHQGRRPANEPLWQSRLAIIPLRSIWLMDQIAA